MQSVFIAHNYYRNSSPSGENALFEAEADLLADKGHTVYRYVRRSDDVASFSIAERAVSGVQAIWSLSSYLAIKRQLARIRPDVAHFHNIFPLISISAFRACRDLRVPVVFTLHNYRPLCVNALLYRDGAVCEKCIGLRLPRHGVFHRCYRGSVRYSAAVAFMQLAQRVSGAWSKDVSLFIAPSEFLRRKYIAAGFDPKKIIVQANFSNHEATAYEGERSYALFVGRLSAEKGVKTLLAAWKLLPDIPLLVLGDGPDGQGLRAEASGLENVSFVGTVSRPEVQRYLRNARYLVVPSEWYENLPMVVLEAFASGTPVIASQLGALPEVVIEGRNGSLFKPRDPSDLARSASNLWFHCDRARLLGMGARRDYESQFTANSHYERLVGIYSKAVVERSALR